MPAVGARSATSSSRRSTRTIERISSSVRDASPSITRSTSAAAAGSWPRPPCPPAPGSRSPRRGGRRCRAGRARAARARAAACARARARGRSRATGTRCRGCSTVTTTANAPMMSPTVGGLGHEGEEDAGEQQVAPPRIIARPAAPAHDRVDEDQEVRGREQLGLSAGHQAEDRAERERDREHHSGRVRRHSSVGTSATRTTAQSHRHGHPAGPHASKRNERREHGDEHPVPPDPPRWRRATRPARPTARARGSSCPHDRCARAAADGAGGRRAAAAPAAPCAG